MNHQDSLTYLALLGWECCGAGFTKLSNGEALVAYCDRTRTARIDWFNPRHFTPATPLAQWRIGWVAFRDIEALIRHWERMNWTTARFMQTSQSVGGALMGISPSDPMGPTKCCT